MGRSRIFKKKLKLNKKTASILLCVAVVVAGGLIFKAIADMESNARIEY